MMSHTITGVTKQIWENGNKIKLREIAGLEINIQ